ncbi:MAG: MerR family transcriptional regulator, partial [Leucobacter sp.]|nr:MerR family transcriptional regulator [Leucobacter sp.]
RLLDTGISLQQIRAAVAQLHEAGVHDLAQTTLMSDGASVYLCTSNDEVIDLVSRGQGVFGIAVGKVLTEVTSSLVDMDEHRDGATGAVDAGIDELAARRQERKSG